MSSQRWKCLLVGLVAPALLAGAVLAAADGRAAAQEAVVGLTGQDRPADVVLSRQLLMDGLGIQMAEIEALSGGAEPDLADLQTRAYVVSTALGVFPHLFPPETMPSDDPNAPAGPTAAAPAIWEDFEGFYQAAQAAASTAFDASQATDAAQFRTLAGDLRAACDSCHERYMQVFQPTFQ